MRVHLGRVLPLAGQVPQRKPGSQLLLLVEHVSPILRDEDDREMNKSVTVMRKIILVPNCRILIEDYRRMIADSG